MYAYRILISQPLRLLLTILGVSLCIVLMLFLLGIYRGVSDGSVDYVKYSNADLWVLQKNCTNILRGTSILSSYQYDYFKGKKEIESVSPVLLLLSTIKKENVSSTVFLTGYNPGSIMGGPPQIISGRNISDNNEIVLDRAIAAKINVKVGDKICIREDSINVVGISTGTNAFVIQYAFVTLDFAQSQLPVPGLVTCFLIKLNHNVNKVELINSITEELPGVVVYDYQTFLNNNIKEMESGILPLLYAVAGLGTIVLTVILSLILSINILERRKDFAVMKTLGSPSEFLPKLIIQQAVLISLVASICAITLFFPMTSMIESLSPEVTTKSTIWQVILVIISVLFMSMISSLISIKRLRKIYPLEAFI